MPPVTLTGTVASLGGVAGRAFRWSPGQDLKKLEQGDILVTKMTTPEMIAGIGRIAGLVTEIGGITCHAAIVAREFNLPAVVAVTEAWRIKNGAMVMLTANIDGKGEVVILDGDKGDKGGVDNDGNTGGGTV